jgi:uncharacterized membrane protein YkoI
MATIHPSSIVVLAVVATAILSGVPKAFADASAPAKKSPITLAQAERIALERVPGGTIEEVERDRHGTRDVFEIEVRDTSGREHEIVIDAAEGRVLSDEIDT